MRSKAFAICRRGRSSAWRLITIVAMGVSAACNSGIDARINRAYELARHQTPMNQERIEALLHDPDRDVRTTALVVISGIDRARADRMADVALQDPDGLVRAAAVVIVAGRPDAEKKAALAGLASQDAVWQVRARALEALTDLEDPDIRELYARGLVDTVRHVRRAALHAGVAHPGLLPVDRLSEVVAADPDWENRVDAARALGASGDALAGPALETASAADPNEFVRATAAQERRRLPALPPAPPPAAAAAPGPKASGAPQTSH